MTRLAPLTAAAAILVVAAALAIGITSTRPAGATAPLDSEEQLLLTLINQHRQQNGLGTLGANNLLRDAATWLSTDMGTHNYFSHCDAYGNGPQTYPCPNPCAYPTCRDPFVRMSDFGYSFNTWKGENIAAGTNSAQTAFDLWKNSPGHNANMLSSNFNVIGIDRTYVAGSIYGWYWTNDFGGFDSGPAPTPVPTATPQPCPGDSDCDGYSDAQETFNGTSVTLDCPAIAGPNNESPDAWPPDFNDDRTVGLADAQSFLASFNTQVPNPNYDPRHDLNADNRIGLADVQKLLPVFNTSCTP